MLITGNFLLQFLSTPNDWENVAQRIDILWNIPDGGEAVDGKHVSTSTNCGNLYFKYKGNIALYCINGCSEC